MPLPVSMNPEDYGTIILTKVLDNFTRYIVTNNKLVYQIDITLDKLINKVSILGAIDLKWTDTQINVNLFKREIGKSIMYFMNGERILRKQVLNAKPFKKVSIDSALNSNFVTMDIETINQRGKLTPYLICAFNGKDYITCYANLVNGVINQKALVTSFINNLLTFFGTENNKLNNLDVYAHNLSSFDGIFILKYLMQFGRVKPLLFRGKLISIKLILNIDGYKGKTIVFKDSYLLLPHSLRNLCKTFNIINPKGYFPFNLTDIFYRGLLPRFNYWTGITVNEYMTFAKPYIGKVWSFQDEAIKYCKLDCKCLHEILIKFNELIFNNFNVNINKSLTLSALAMRIYQSKFMPENTIYQLLGIIQTAIRESYTGGAVDMYIPHNRIGSFISGFFKKLYCYDVNGLYPFIMANVPMPIGLPTFFDGNIRHLEPNAYGFFYCKITSPEYLDHPILQRRIKTENGIRTVAGLGSWTGWINSIEMDNAVRFGYKFEIIKGYQFDTADIFSQYINKMYELRLEYPKPHPINLIAKLLMNSLYGKFGMKLESTKVELFDCSSEAGVATFKLALDKAGHSVKDFIKLDDTFIIIRDSKINVKFDDELDMYHGQDVNIAIASAITAGARVEMSVFKNNPNFILYYSDTDSIVISVRLPSEMVGNKLGQMKLEYVISRAVFLAPKVYGFIDVDGNEIIKVKGVTQEVASQLHVSDLEQLLIVNSHKTFIQNKWFKNLIAGEISVSDVEYTLGVTSNKRQPVYNEGVLENTRPYKYDQIISSNNIED